MVESKQDWNHYLGILQLPTGELFPYGDFSNGFQEVNNHIKALKIGIEKEEKLHYLLPYFERALTSNYPFFEQYLVTKGVNILLNLSRNSKIEHAIFFGREGIDSEEVTVLQGLNEVTGILNDEVLKECYLCEGGQQFRMVATFQDIEDYAKNRCRK